VLNYSGVFRETDWIVGSSCVVEKGEKYVYFVFVNFASQVKKSLCHYDISVYLVVTTSTRGLLLESGKTLCMPWKWNEQFRAKRNLYTKLCAVVAHNATVEMFTTRKPHSL
jgi:hypothetical protein